MEKPETKLGAIKGNQINWNQVFHFCQIAFHGSVREAANSLGLSASTLSEHLQQLERDLNVELFSRQHRKMTLTPQGSRLFQHAKQMFEAGQRLIDVVSPIALGCYPVSVGLVPSPSAWLAYRVLDEFLGRFGPFSLKAHQTKHEELEKGLCEARFDFGFSDRGSERKDIAPEIIFSSFIRFYVAPKREGKSLEELFQNLPILYFNNDSTTRGFVEHLFSELGLTPRETVTSEFPGLLFELCESGRGVGVFNEASVKLLGSKLKPISLPQGTLEIQDKLYVLWAKGAENSDAVQRLKDVLSTRRFLETAREPTTDSDHGKRRLS